MKRTRMIVLCGSGAEFRELRFKEFVDDKFYYVIHLEGTETYDSSTPYATREEAEDASERHMSNLQDALISIRNPH